MLLQLVEPKAYEKFCDDTIVAVVNVHSSHEGEDDIGLGISLIDADDPSDMNFDDERSSENKN